MAAALLISALASGQGKTPVAAALARLHARQGRRVRCFKCCPDFLDPLWLQAASGQPVDSLDLWINGDADCARRLFAAATDADLVIVEGVMGLFDGQPSAADLAQRFGMPVVAVIDASAMAGTFAAVAHGLQTWQPALPWAGVLANRVGSARHAAMLQTALREPRHWLGHLPRNEAFGLPERHLGLRMPRESGDVLARLDAAADALATTPLGQRIASDWPVWQAPAAGPAQALPPLLDGLRIALANDEAFAFVYPANVAVLQALGAQVLPFSPLAGDSMPDCDALWLPGGYPELHVAELAGLTDLRAQITEHVRAGRPVWAECGGMMAPAERLVDAQGRTHELWGLLPGTAVLGRRLAALGSHQLQLPGHDQAALRGHSFHWSRFETPLPASAHTEPALGIAAGAGEPVYERGSLRASWFHPWFASSPRAAARLFLPAPLWS